METGRRVSRQRLRRYLLLALCRRECGDFKDVQETNGPVLLVDASWDLGLHDRRHWGDAQIS